MERVKAENANSFQDSYASLNSTMTVEEIIKEPLQIYKMHRSIDELLNMVGLSFKLKKRYCRELSGGQCRRVNLARALALGPSFIITDELTSGLDLTVQAGLIKLILELQKNLKITCLFISHDLDVVEYLADRVGIMKNGKLIETGEVGEIFSKPKHHYTQELLASRLSIY